jgi:hypothetical protein
MNQDIVNVIRSTYDYGMFKIHQRNRCVNKNHVACLVELINANDLGIDYPIIIDEEYNIIDGQHRFVARQESKKEIYYICAKVTKIENVAGANIITLKWTPMDFVTYFSKHGNEKEHYIKFKSFIDNFAGLSVHTAAMILGYHDSGSQKTGSDLKQTITIKEGTFKFPEGNQHEIDTQRILEICEHMDGSDKKIKRVVVRAYISHIKPTEGYNHEQLIKNMKRRKIKSLNVAKDLAMELNDVYNYGLTTQNRISFHGVKD